MTRRQISISRNRKPRIAVVLALIGMTAGVLVYRTSQTNAEPTGPSQDDRRVALVVSQLMKFKHLSRHPLDDEIASRCLKGYLESIDPRKSYFMQSDIDEFQAKQHQIDDAVSNGNVNFAYEIFDRYLQRVDEKGKLIEQILSQPFDFTIDEGVVVDPDSLTNPKTEAEAHDRWRKRLKYDVMKYMVEKKIDAKEATEKIRRRYHFANKRMHQMKNDNVLELYLTSLTNGFDPHSTYMSASRLENFNIIMRLQLEGIGASLQAEDGYTVVRKIITGGAADKDGRLKVDDHIVAVGQGPQGEMVDVVEMPLDDVVHLIRGKKGTIVRLGVTQGGEGEMKTYEITREKVELKDSEARGEIIPFGKKADGAPMKIGVINLPSFYMDMEAARAGVQDYKSCTNDVKAILSKFRRENVDAVLMDLRMNGGGSLVESVNLTGLFIDRGPVVQVKGPDGRITPHVDNDSGVAWNGPLVVMISKFSASASEIFAGAVQDYHRGLVIGDKTTHGKGTVQQVFGVSEFLAQDKNYGALKLTIQQFYLPDGASTQSRGVISDVELPSVRTHSPFGETDLDYALKFNKVKPLSHLDYKQVNPVLVNALKLRSSERMSQSEDFGKVLKNVARYLERKNRKTMTLNETKYRAEIAEYDEDKEEDEEDGEPSDEIFKRDFYSDEALAIAHDYVQLLKGRQVAGTAHPGETVNN